MVINECNALGENSPIVFIHDVGAGGLACAIPELVKVCSFYTRKDYILNKLLGCWVRRRD